MIAFGSSTAGAQDLTARNDWIQKTLLATRPYGATPIAGILDDARAFLRSDTTKDPFDLSKDFGPYRDPFMSGGCRSTHIILLTDGEPNMDLRPSCEGRGHPDGQCPFEKPEEIADDLAHTGDQSRRVLVHVVGFALPTVTLSNSQQVDCTDLSDNDLTGSTGLCATYPDERMLQACCTLNRIAFNGGTGRAHFANNSTELRQAIAEILRASASPTSRTLPAFSSGAAGFGGANGFRFFSSFRPTRQGLWTGVLERQRFVCDSSSLEALPRPIDPQKGDDFAANLNSGVGPARRMLTVIGNMRQGVIHSARSIRPSLGENDGAGLYSGVVIDGSPDLLASQTPPGAALLPDSSCARDGLGVYGLRVV
jgi:type IV pilus assembly protein PilY1